jgi:hypothetical protein
MKRVIGTTTAEWSYDALNRCQTMKEEWTWVTFFAMETGNGRLVTRRTETEKYRILYVRHYEITRINTEQKNGNNTYFF